MTNLITDSLEYLSRSDTFLWTLAVGGVLTFAYQLFLMAVFVSVTSSGDVVNGPFIDGASMVVQVGLTTLGLVSFIVLEGYYVRIAECVIAGEETPPGFADSKRLVFNGILFCATLLAVVTIVLAVQAAVFTLIIVSFTVLDLFLGIPFIDTALFFLSVFFTIITAISVVYPLPSIWILIARFRVWNKPGQSYLQFVASRRFPSGLSSILFSRRYASSWVALVVVSTLHGAAITESDSIFTVSQPIDLIVSLNISFASAIVSFYASVAVVYIFATRFRETDPYRQTSFHEFESSHDSR